MAFYIQNPYLLFRKSVETSPRLFVAGSMKEKVLARIGTPNYRHGVPPNSVERPLQKLGNTRHPGGSAMVHHENPMAKKWLVGSGWNMSQLQ